LNNLRHDEAFCNAAILLKELTKGKQVIYSPNNGNWGDGLIHRGLVAFLEYCGIEYKRVPKKKVIELVTSIEEYPLDFSNTILISGGGGAWCKNYNSNYQFVSKVAKAFHKVIVMPNTYELSEAKNSDNVIYFRRDKYNSRESIPNSIFCHDMAFFLDLDIEKHEKTTEIGHFFREDPERSKEAVTFEGNIDLSAKGAHFTDVTPFFDTIAKCKKVKTDRMHVAIASCLLGVPVELYVGNYFKSRAVFQSSIQDNYKLCKLVEWDS